MRGAGPLQEEQEDHGGWDRGARTPSQGSGGPGKSRGSVNTCEEK